MSSLALERGSKLLLGKSTPRSDARWDSIYGSTDMGKLPFDPSDMVQAGVMNRVKLSLVPIRDSWRWEGWRMRSWVGRILI